MLSLAIRLASGPETVINPDGSGVWVVPIVRRHSKHALAVLSGRRPGVFGSVT